MRNFEQEIKDLDKLKKEKLVITRIGLACNFPGCDKPSGYKINFLGDIVFLCEGHKKYLSKKLELEFIEVDSRTFNKIPPKFREYLAGNEGIKHLKGRWIATPITGKTFRMRKPNRKQKEGMVLGHLISDMKVKIREIETNTKITIIEPWEQKTYSALELEKGEK